MELTSDIDVHSRPNFNPHGITYDDNDVYIASHEKIGIFDRYSFEYKGNLSVKSFVNTHQILKHGNLLFVTNTCNDSISIIDLLTKEHEYIDVRNLCVTDTCIETEEVREHDKHHVNSLCVDNNRLYFCLHNGPLKKPSSFYYYDLINKNFVHIIDAGEECHDIVILGDMLYTNSSGTRQLLKIDMIEKSIQSFDIMNIPNDNWLRGLVKYGNKLLVGESNFTPFNRPGRPNIDPRLSDEIKYAQLHLFDLTTNKIDFFFETNQLVLDDFKII